MARSRNLKPSFFTNELLGELTPLCRLLFAGLWTLADRAGKLEDRPFRIKAAILPYDSCNVDKLLNQLQEKEFILRYQIQVEKCIQIINFHKHQNPHPKEAVSVIPSPESRGISTASNGNAGTSNAIPSLSSFPSSISIPSLSSGAVEKHKHLDFVLLGEEEYQDLIKRFGQEGTDQRIKKLNNYVGSKGKKYESHYFTILSWEDNDDHRKQESTTEAAKSSDEARAQARREKRKAQGLSACHGSPIEPDDDGLKRCTSCMVVQS